jgi:hypothetical protein
VIREKNEESQRSEHKLITITANYNQTASINKKKVMAFK